MKIKIIRFLSFAVFTVFTISQSAFAQDAQMLKMLQDLQKQMQQMQNTINWQNDRIMSLEGKAAPQKATYIMPKESDDPKGVDIPDWLDGLDFNGDMRLRYEGRENDDSARTATADRNRFRYRLRFGFTKDFHNDFSVGFRLASVAAGGVNSTNETLGDGFAYDPISIDKAYATWKPSFVKNDFVKGAEITAGKFANPLKKRSSKIVWDGDVTPEGIYEKVDLAIFNNEDISIKFSPLLGQWILGETGGRNDREMWVYSGEVSTKLKDSGVKHKVAVNFYDVSSGFTVPDYHGLQVYNEIGIKIADLPVKAYMDWIHNLQDSAGDDENGWVLGAQIGKANKQGSWQLGYAMANMSTNSVLAAFDDSDFGGAREGHIIKGAYALTDSLTFKTALFLTNATGTGDERLLFQSDLIWKF